MIIGEFVNMLLQVKDSAAEATGRLCAETDGASDAVAQYSADAGFSAS